jgi:AcrR family transcriptional regulator
MLMSMGTSEAAMVEGLRERKKLKTRKAIVQVALELFDRQGFAATTIPQIAAAADVSPRTVSTYFPAKEDLVFSDSAEGFDRLEARLTSRAANETTVEALRAWLAEEAPRWDDAQSAITRRVVRASEHLRTYSKHYVARIEELVAHSIAADLSADPDGLEARMASAATLAIFSVLDAHKDAEAAACSAETSRGDAIELLDRALLFVGAGIRALQSANADSAPETPAAR